MTRHGPGVLRRLHSTGLEGAKTGVTRIHRRVLTTTLAERGPLPDDRRLPRLLHLPVFYDTLKRPYSHVGIYLGDGKFVHSPKSGAQVRIESLKSTYWTQRYNGARRIEPSL